MARADKKGRRKSGPPFVQLYRHMLEAPAWLGLKPAARVVYLQIACRYNGTNNGFLAASNRDLSSECRADPKTITASINTLIECGFIERTQEGSFACKIGMAAEYRLACFRCDRTGRNPSNAFRQWGGSNAGATPVGLNAEEGGNHVQAGI